jgi:hypothetical protein
LHYLHDVNLLQPALRFFENVSVDKSTEDHARATRLSADDSAEIVAVIQEIRTAVHTAWSKGTLQFGPRYQEGEKARDDRSWANVPTFHLLGDLKQADAVVIDDRALNRESYVIDGKGHHARIATTLDLLEDLRARGALTDGEHRSFRHKLHTAGVMLVPASVDEIVSAARRSKNKESAELRAIRESISLARTAAIPAFPAEMPWFAQTTLAIKQAIVRVWTEEPNQARAARLASAIFELRPRPEEWREQWHSDVPPQWAEEIEAVIAASLAMAVDLTDPATLKAYHAWLDDNLLGPMRELTPSIYEKVVQRVRSFILTAPTDGGDDE